MASHPERALRGEEMPSEALAKEGG